MENKFEPPARRVVNEDGKSIYRVEMRGLALVEELAARGCSVVTIARALGMSREAFNACRKRQPEVEETFERGRAVEHDALVSNLRQAAEEGNIVASIFLLKARHQYREGEALEANVNLSVNTGGVLVVPSKMSMEEFFAERRNAGMLDLAPKPGTIERIPGGSPPNALRGERGD